MIDIGNALLFSIIISHKDQQPLFLTLHYGKIFSTDDGSTWSEPQNLSPMLKNCNPNINNMEVQTAGSKVQTESGRFGMGRA